MMKLMLGDLKKMQTKKAFRIDLWYVCSDFSFPAKDPSLAGHKFWNYHGRRFLISQCFLGCCADASSLISL